MLKETSGTKICIFDKKAMVIEQKDGEVIFKVSGNFNADDLQDMADFLEFMEISGKSKARQEDVDKLVKKVKKGRWEITKNDIHL